MSDIQVFTKMFRQHPELLTVQDLQNILGLSKNTAYKLVNEKKISHVRIGRKIRIPKSAIIKYLAEQKA